MPGRPTPTQDELNKIALGEEVTLSDDGSGPDPHNKPVEGGVLGGKPAAAHPATHAPRATHAERK